MKTIIKITTLSILIAVFISCSNNQQKKEENASAETMDTAKLKTGDVYYHCEMHPEVMSDKPGSCSKCGMDLEKVEKK